MDRKTRKEKTNLLNGTKSCLKNIRMERAKFQVISTAIKKCYISNDADVPLYSTLLKKIVERDWTASDIVNSAALVNSEIGLSPFAMIDLTEEDVALMKQDHEYLLNTSLLSKSEVMETRTKLIASTPTDSEGLMMMLKIF